MRKKDKKRRATTFAVKPPAGDALMSDAVFSTKLAALEYPERASFNVSDETAVRALIVWLEDRKIRHYQIKDRQALRQVVMFCSLSRRVLTNGFSVFLL
jgi:hypothetical protein